MARLISLIVLLVGAGLADESSNKDFQLELLKMLNETNQKLNLLTKLVHDHAEDAENQFGDVRKTLKCLRASSAKTTLLSNGKMYSFQLVEKSWSSANETCEKQGLHLAKIRDSDDLKLVLEEGNKSTL
ncbi:uncharacterized protein LOC132193906 isoform X2 [Neocloeon triangulifer]|uniref:uncharacterized protein LOC132193906 isoform X2 n=1 Tax=Neocloeon triangulifer TaxID=2078957 RepID=UPI00286F282D|nr:uncharacterized protein LOC132193906 isoform X2 [Neocloeon triangulifer]